MSRVLILGSGGTLGTLAAEGLALRGWDVHRAERASGARSVDVLRDNPGEVLIRTGATAVLYLAWATRDRSDEVQAAHARAAGRWAAEAARLGTTLVFASTTLAAPGVRSAYGRWKACAEEEVWKAGGTVARIGLVIDDAIPGLLATRLRRAFRRLPVLAQGLNWPVFPIGSGPLVAALASILEQPIPRAWIAEDAPTSLATLATWPSPSPRHRPLQPLYSLLAPLPMPRAFRPVLLDGWVGLVSGPSIRAADFCPIEPAIGLPGTWHAFTRPA